MASAGCACRAFPGNVAICLHCQTPQTLGRAMRSTLLSWGARERQMLWCCMGGEISRGYRQGQVLRCTFRVTAMAASSVHTQTAPAGLYSSPISSPCSAAPFIRWRGGRLTDSTFPSTACIWQGMFLGLFFLIPLYHSRAEAPLFVEMHVLSSASPLLLWLKHNHQKLLVPATALVALAMLTWTWVSHGKAPGSNSFSQGRTRQGEGWRELLESLCRGWAPPAPGPLGSQSNSSLPFSANYSCDHTTRGRHSAWTLAVHYPDSESRWAWHLSPASQKAAPKSCYYGKGKTPSTGKQAKFYISQLPQNIMSTGATTLVFIPSCSSCNLQLKYPRKELFALLHYWHTDFQWQQGQIS